MKYKLEKCIDGEWFDEGTYETLTMLGESCLLLGRSGVKQVRVEEVGLEDTVPSGSKAKPMDPVPDLYKPEGWGTGWSKEPHQHIYYNPINTSYDKYHDAIHMAKDDEVCVEYKHNEPPKEYIRKSR